MRVLNALLRCFVSVVRFSEVRSCCCHFFGIESCWGRFSGTVAFGKALCHFLIYFLLKTPKTSHEETRCIWLIVVHLLAINQCCLVLTWILMDFAIVAEPGQIHSHMPGMPRKCLRLSHALCACYFIPCGNDGCSSLPRIWHLTTKKRKKKHQRRELDGS